MQRGVDVVCATPGRLNDHLKRGTMVRAVVCFFMLYITFHSNVLTRSNGACVCMKWSSALFFVLYIIIITLASSIYVNLTLV